MSGKSNPSALMLKWQLVDGFDVLFVQPPKAGSRLVKKKMGTVVEMKDTEKGKVDNKTDQVLMFISTSSMDDDAAPYALQVALLDFKGLDKEILQSYNKKLPNAPTPIQIASKQALFSNTDIMTAHACVVY